MHLPETSDESGAKDARRVHRRSRERSTKQNIQRDCRANRQTRSAPPSFIHYGPVHNKNKEERQDSFDQDTLPRSEIDRELRCAGYDNITAKKTETDEGRRDAT